MAASAARAYVEAALESSELTALTENVTLVVSELVTNAVRYAPELLTLECFISAEGRFVVEVADPSTTLPKVGEAGPFDVHGRGLVIVEALADEWGARLTDEMGGKIVWAAFEVPAAPRGRASGQVVHRCGELLKRVLDRLRLSP
jgi:anti-sigma regulatory factor (Ser/Thr protein kinase)